MLHVHPFLYFCRGNALRQGSAWRGSRATAALLLVTVSVFAAALWLYVTSLDSDVTETLVSQAEFVSPQPRVYNIQCSEDYNNYKRYPGELCLPCKALDNQLLTSDVLLWFKQEKGTFSFLLRIWCPLQIYMYKGGRGGGYRVYTSGAKLLTI